MDFGCSFHMYSNIYWFQNFNNKEIETVYMGNNHSYNVKGICNISLKLHDDKTRTLTDVRYVLGLKRNLISLGTLDELGFSYRAENGSMHVFKGDELILIGAKKNGLYVLNGCYFPSVNMYSICIAKTDKTKLWHLRLGHMSLKSLKALSNQGYLGSMHVRSLDFCEPCVLGKQNRLSFHKGTHLAKVCLDYVHVNLWGPSQVSTHDGNKYLED